MWKGNTFLVILGIVSMQINTAVEATLDEGPLQDLGGGPVDSEAVLDFQATVNFDLEPLVQRSIAALSPSELVQEVERLAESVITEDKSNTNIIPPYQTSDPPAYDSHMEVKEEPTSMNPDQSETYDVTNTPDPATPESVTTDVEDVAPVKEENELGSGSPSLSLTNVDTPDQESPASATTLFGKTLAIEDSNIEQSWGSIKESLESLSQQPPSLSQDFASLKPLEETGPADIIVKIKFIKSEFEPFLIPFPMQRGLDLKPDDPVPPFLIDMPPVSVPKPRAKSVKKDLGATNSPTEVAVTSERAQTSPLLQVSSSNPVEETSRTKSESEGLLSSDQSKPSERILETTGIHLIPSQELKIQELMPETQPPVELEPSAEQQKPDDPAKAVSNSLESAKPPPFHFLTGPFVIQGNTVRPNMQFKQEGAAEMPFTNFIKALAGLGDGLIDLAPFNDAQAQVIADA